MADALKVMVEIEEEACNKRLEDLVRLKASLGNISSVRDQATFVGTAKRPELTHSASAALSLLHQLDQRGSAAPIASTPSPTRPSPAALDTDDDAVSDALSADRTLHDMERIVIALFAPTVKWEKAGEMAAPPAVEPDAAAAAPPLEVDPLHALHIAEKPAAAAGPLITMHDKRRLNKMLESDSGREAFIRSLNQQRSRRTEIGEGFEELASAIGIVLDNCRAFRDIHTAKMTMMLSQASAFTFIYRGGCFSVLSRTFSTHQTFYREVGASAPSRESREYLKTALINHPLWRFVTTIP